MEKTFGLIKPGDKLYKVSVRASRLMENKDGSIIESLNVEEINSASDFYTMKFLLSDMSEVYLNRNVDVQATQPVQTSSKTYPMGLYEDLYSTKRSTLMTMASKRLNEHSERMKKLRQESGILLNNSIVSEEIINQMLKVFVEDEEPKMTEVEFAEMAL